MIKKLTFSGANVTSNDDSVLYKALGADDRILKGCEITSATDKINIASGYLSVHGRQLKVEGTETVEVPAAVVATPYNLVLEIDMDNDTQEFKAITSSPVQEDIAGGTGLYQMLMATFTMSSDGISDIRDAAGRGGLEEFVGGTLQAGETILTISDSRIREDAFYDIYTDKFQAPPLNVEISEGEMVLTFGAQSEDVKVKVRVF